MAIYYPFEIAYSNYIDEYVLVALPEPTFSQLDWTQGSKGVKTASYDPVVQVNF